MNFHGSLSAILCYAVTVLLLYLLGDATDIRWLQFSKEITFESEDNLYTSRSIAPLLLGLPVYAIVLYKSKQI